jgi:16S rRNA processing protein RimM
MVAMGRISAPFGIKGWVKIHPFTESPQALRKFPIWWLEMREGWEPWPVAEVKVHRDSIIARLEGCADRAQAARLKGLTVAVPRSALVPLGSGEYYLCDLVGLKVLNRQNEPLGEVIGFVETGGNLVLKIQAEKERLIPFVESVVQAVDLERGQLRVDWEADY